MSGGKSSNIQYEVLVQKEGRWQLNGMMGQELDKLGRNPTEREIQKVEDQAIAKAKGLLATGDYQAAKVVKETVGFFGHKSTKEIFNEQSTVKKEERLIPQPPKGPIPVCEEPGDLLQRPACRVASIVFRDFLQKHGITAIELVHCFPHFRRLDDNSTLLQGGLHLIASKQAESMGVPGRQRMAQLQDMTQKILNKARDAQADRKVPALQDFNVDQLAERVAIRYEDAAEQRYYIMVSLSRELLGQGSHMARLDLALKCLPTSESVTNAELLDELIAGCLDMPQMIMELLGTRNSLAEAIMVMAGLSRGAFVPSKDSNPIVNQLLPLFEEGRLIHAADSLWDRITRETGGGASLVRNDLKREWTETLRLIDLLGKMAPPTYRDAIVQNLEQRLTRLRERDD